MSIKCIDCIIEDLLTVDDAVEAVTVTNGFALCQPHLERYVLRLQTSNNKAITVLENYCETLT